MSEIGKHGKPRARIYALGFARRADARENRQPSPQFRRPAHHGTRIMSDNVSSGSLTAPTATSGGDHLLARLVGVIFSPQATFARIVAQPRWLGALALVTVVDQPDYVHVPEHGGRPDGLAGSAGPAVGGVRAALSTRRPTSGWKSLRRTSAMSARGFTLVIVPIMTVVIVGHPAGDFQRAAGRIGKLQAGGGGPEPRRRHLARAAAVHCSVELRAGVDELGHQSRACSCRFSTSPTSSAAFLAQLISSSSGG